MLYELPRQPAADTPSKFEGDFWVKSLKHNSLYAINYIFAP
jgi:hypothetical protein